jgi:Ni/Fe-hydrogenase subunit HybB-like protein
LFPIPNYNGIWPNFRSPLLWDVFAISTYATVSLLFWYTGLIPDLATLRDRATTKWRQRIYGVLALGWRGSGRHWHHYETACLILAGISTPLVVSVHTIVSADFATSNVPGWHATIFPPYFVAGAIFSGFAMVLTLMIPLRQAYNLKDIVTDRHLEVMCKIILATGTMVGFAYATEFFSAWYGGDEAEQYCFSNRAFGPYWWAYWIMVSCNVLSPQVFWFKRFRTNPWVIFGVSILVNVGMWFERFVIIVTSLHRDRLLSSWGMFTPTWVDGLQMIGAFGLFLTLVLLFIRVLPMIALSEVKGQLPTADPHHAGGHVGNGEVQRAGEQAAAEVPSVPEVPGVAVAAFGGPGELLAATKKVREAGYRKFDTHSPFPIHGMDRALGMGRSELPWIVLGGGITGFLVAGLGMLWINTIDYPLIVGGKPYGALEPLVPITFELTVLFSAFATVGGLLWMCGLPRYYHPAYRHDHFARVTTDAFYITIDATDPKFHPQETPAFLSGLGGSRVAVLEA